MTLSRKILLEIIFFCVGLACATGQNEEPEVLIPSDSRSSYRKQSPSSEIVSSENGNSTLLSNFVNATDQSSTEEDYLARWKQMETEPLLEDVNGQDQQIKEESGLQLDTEVEASEEIDNLRDTNNIIANHNVSHNAPAEQHAIRIIVVGRSGSGVSSTIRELIGNVTKCEKPEGAEETLQNIYEYTISDIPNTTSQIRLVDIPGFLDGRTLEQESQILATLKSYYIRDSNSTDFFLALSRFDDNRYIGPHSLFTQFLKRLDLFKQKFVEQLPENKMNMVFLLTRLMSETKTIRRRPNDKIDSFRKVIEEFTSFEPPIPIVVGDNKANAEHNAKVENGYSKLPNKEHYPKNVWEALINVTASEVEVSGIESKVHSVLNAIKDNREVEMRCKVNVIRTDWAEYNADADAFLYLLQQQPNLRIEDTEVNLKINEAFKEFPSSPDQVEAMIQKTALQLYLQTENITKIEDIPSSYSDRAAFFQKTPLISNIYPALLLNDAFDLDMPEYIQPLTVGYGYDVLSDELSLETPFNAVTSLSSSTGYKFPNFMKCRKFAFHETQIFQSYSHNVSDYFKERLNYLNFVEEEVIDFAKAKFGLRAKEGFNLAPEEGVEITTLAAVKEFRTLKCNLAEKEHWGELNDEFVETINELKPVDVYDKNSITEWTIFFGRYGSHIVTQGYGGGSLLGGIVGKNVKKVFQSRSTIDDTLDSILKFSPFSVPDLEKPAYGLFGGEVREASQQITQMYDLSEAKRDQILEEWEKSLNSNFMMLKNEFTLERISTVVKEKLGVDKGEMVDNAIGLLLKGELIKKRRRSSSTSTGNRRNVNRGTVRPSPRPTTTPTQPSSTPSHETYYYPSSSTTHRTPVTESWIPYHPPAPPTSTPPSYSSSTTTNRYSNFPIYNVSGNDNQNNFPERVDSVDTQLRNVHEIYDAAKERDDRLYQEEITNQERREQDSLALAKRRENAMLANAEKRAENERSRHDIRVNAINEQMDIERRHTENMIEDLRQRNEEANARHEELMRKLRLPTQKPTKKPKKGKRVHENVDNKCNGYGRQSNPACW